MAWDWSFVVIKHEHDYPAAHSMDTEWFAVDQMGNVAHFDSLESGAVPECAFRTPNIEESLDQIRVWFPRHLPTEVSMGRLPGWLLEKGCHELVENPEWVGILFVRSLDLAKSAIEREVVRVIPAGENHALILLQAIPKLVRKIHEAGDCLNCFSEPLLYTNHVLRQAISYHGVYEYEHLTENWTSGPYGKFRTPAAPLHVDELPPTLRDSIRQMTFTTLCFEDTNWIQPIEHSPCLLGRECSWIDAESKVISPIAGREEQFESWSEGCANLFADLGLKKSEPEDDYPAAHSMSTTWFAVDQAGSVTEFAAGKTLESDDPVRETH